MALSVMLPGAEYEKGNRWSVWDTVCVVWDYGRCTSYVSRTAIALLENDRTKSFRV